MGAAPGPGQGSVPSLRREPAIAREEARRLVPDTPEVSQATADRLEMSPDQQRRRLNELREALTPALRPQATLRIRALEGELDYDEQDQIVYGPGRTRITFGEMTLEADRVLLDSRLQEIQAEGNVELDARGNKIYAESLRYNFDRNEGVAFQVHGQYGPAYFRNFTEEKKEDEGPTLPQMQMISEHESIFRNTDITACDFTVPHYYIRGREVILFPNDRVFFRGATFYVMNVPVFYLPVYSRSMTEPSPWFMSVGYGSRTGARVRIGYGYNHRTEEPALDDDTKMETRESGTARIYADYISEFGPGLGFDYEYMFNFGRDRGELSLYGINDGDRNAIGTHDPDPLDDRSEFTNETERWRAYWRHNTDITRNLSLKINADWFSDPDIFYDVLDLFTEDERDREVTRRARVALTLVEEAYVIRLMAEVKDRIGLDRFTDFSDSRDNDRDFDLDPFNELNDEKDVDGISRDRWGRVSNKLPQIDAATRWLPFGRDAWFYRTELHLYNSLDKGLNIVNDRDDAYVQGAEFYQAVMKRFKLSPRVNIVGRAGIGFGGADRTDELGFPIQPGPNQAFPFRPTPLRGVGSGLVFTDEDTFLIGRRKKSFDDLNPAYMWGDTEWQMNARFSDALSGLLKWSFRETTDDFIGDWYASLGSRTVREDLYEYKLRRHWVEGRLDYRLFRPLMSLYTAYGLNLLSDGDLYPNEDLSYWNNGMLWTNQRQTLTVNLGVGTQRRQIFDISDPRAFEQTSWNYFQAITYAPVHQRWYLRLRNNYRENTREHNSTEVDENLTFFDETNESGDFRLTYGRQLGPKWATEIGVAYDYEIGGVDDVRWRLERDMHDATGVLEVRARRNPEELDSRDEKGENEIDMRFGLNFKLPGQEVALGPGQNRSLRDRAKQPVLAQ